jgi:hypothetical protein
MMRIFQKKELYAKTYIKKYHLKDGHYNAVERQDEFVKDLGLAFDFWLGQCDGDVTMECFYQAVKEVSHLFDTISYSMNKGEFLPRFLWSGFYKTHVNDIKNIIHFN